MNRFLKWVFGLLFLAALGIGAYLYFGTDVFHPRLSPADTVSFKMNDWQMEVFYNRPSKRGREVFGALVPYNQVWRTGANEATTFETNKPISLENHVLPAGKYTLWTIPNDTLWQVIFNSKQYPWGVDETMKPMREPEFDVLDLSVKPQKLDTAVEQFTIGFDNSTDNVYLTFAWDQVKLMVPIKEQ